MDGTHREAVGAVVVVQRVDVRRVEVQVTAVVRRVRHGRPEVAVAADVVHRARRVVAIARSRKESNHLLNGAEDSRKGTNPAADWFFITDDNATRSSEDPLRVLFRRRWVTEFTRHSSESLDLRNSGPESALNGTFPVG